MEIAKEEALKRAKELTCHYCDQVFTSYNGRTKHEKIQHDKLSKKEFNCGWDQCDHKSYNAARQCRYRKRK